MSVITLSDLDAVSKFIQVNSKCCIYYTADWCGPCQAIKPVYKDLASTYAGNVALGTVNVDDNPTAAAEAKVSSIPTFTLFNNNKPFQTFTGADANKLRESLSVLAEK
jgi:thioredoxin 1